MAYGLGEKVYDMIGSGQLTTRLGKKKAKSKGKVGKVMHEFKKGTLRSGSKTGPKVKNRKQAIAIAMSEARRAGQRS